MCLVSVGTPLNLERLAQVQGTDRNQLGENREGNGGISVRGSELLQLFRARVQTCADNLCMAMITRHGGRTDVIGVRMNIRSMY